MSARQQFSTAQVSKATSGKAICCCDEMTVSKKKKLVSVSKKKKLEDDRKTHTKVAVATTDVPQEQDLSSDVKKLLKKTVGKLDCEVEEEESMPSLVRESESDSSSDESDSSEDDWKTYMANVLGISSED